MTLKQPMKLLSLKACVKIVCEMRWNSCGKMMTASGETVLHSGMDEGENQERGVGSSKSLTCLYRNTFKLAKNKTVKQHNKKGK